MENRLRKRISAAIAKRVFPGCAIGVISADKEFIKSYGHFTYAKKAKRVKHDSIFDLASVTKSIPTASLALKLIEEGKLSLEDRVANYIPELANLHRDKVLVRHLLTHTLYYDVGSRLSSHKEKSPKEFMEIIYNLGYRVDPGTTYAYANANSILLGIILERVGRDTIDALADAAFFKPLEMSRTTFDTGKFSKNEIVPTEFDSWRGRLIQGEIHDESAWSLSKEKAVGSAGLFSTVPDLMLFVRLLLEHGQHGEKEIFQPKTIQLMHTNQIKHLGRNHGVGWELYQRRYMGTRAGPNTFGKTGFTGCSVVCDIPRKVGVILLSNYIYPERKPNADAINNVRHDIADIVFSCR